MKASTQKKLEAIRATVAEGKPLASLAGEFGCTPVAIYLLARRYGITPAGSRKSAPSRNESFVEEVRRLALNYARPIVRAELMAKIGV